MIEVETQTTEVEIINNVEVISAGQVEVETVDLSDLDITVAKKEYVITGDDIYIPMLYDDAPQWMKDLVQVVVDVSISSGTQSLINDMNAIIQDFAVSYVPLNQYTQSIIDLGDEDTRLNGLIETLNSNFNDGLSTANAQIISLQLTKASKDEVVAQVIQTIAAQLADGASNIGSTIGRIDQAIANETSARATSFQVLTSSLEDTNLDVTANATATSALNTYVGLELGTPNGTGLLADVEILQKQNDGVIETTTGTYDVMISPENPDLAQLVITAEPYVTWKASDVSGIDTRLAHIGDVYVKYADTSNGAKEYIASYKFIRTAVDSTSPYATDIDGFTWALIMDQAAQDAYELALNAYDLADGKITSYYTSTYTSMLAISDGWTAEEKLRNTGDLAVVWNDSTLDNNGTWRWNGTSWVTTRDKKLIALASDVTALSTELDNGTNTWASADSTLENSLMTEISDEGARVESKFAYNSLLNINGVYKKSGFGLTTNYVSGSGTEVDPYVSEFWIDASRFKFTNSNVTGSVAPFTIDASGVTPQITFNGKVSFSNVTGTGNILTTGQAATDINAGTTTINGPKITTGSITASQIAANSISADRLSPSNGNSTVWSGGGLISSNFNGNPVGHIGNPSQGFRLSSNAAGTVTDPNIYGAFIRSSYLMKGSYIVDSDTGAYGHALCSVTVGTFNASGSNPSSYSSQFAVQGNIADLSTVIISNNCKISTIGTITGYGSGDNTTISLYLDVVDAGGNIYARHTIMSRIFILGGKPLWSFGYGNNLSIYIPTHYRLRLAIITNGYSGDLHDAYFNVSWSNM